MGAIEKKIIDTIKDCMSDSFSRNETFTLSIRDKVINHYQEKISYSLWEIPIFELRKEEKDYVAYFSFCNWSSKTTKSRLNALLSAFAMGYFFQKDWEIYYESSNQKAVKIDPSKVYTIANGQLSEV